VLDNGVTLLQQRNTSGRALCIGVWLRKGSRDERPGEEGMCHFLEHMLFKGTERRTAFEISQAVEKVGGSIDAFTTKEEMCVYVQLMENHWELALEVMGDMFTGSVFSPDQIALEKKVVLDEIRDAVDSPDDYIHELFSSTVLAGHPLGRPILGKRSTVSAFSRKRILRFAGESFKSRAFVIAAYGNVPPGKLAGACEKHFRFKRGGPAKRRRERPRGAARRKHHRRPIHQVYVCMGGRGYAVTDERRFPLIVLSTLLGGGMSSRLFQKIREEQGLAYSVYTFTEQGSDTGLFGVYMSLRPGKKKQALASVMSAFAKIIRGELGKSELEEIKEYLRGRILLGLETSSSKMIRMARNEIHFGRQVPEREILSRIKAVTRDDLVAVAEETLDPGKVSIVSLGPDS